MRLIISFHNRSF